MRQRFQIPCRDADGSVPPSHAEGQAMALLVAMAHGLAIITIPVGTHLEVDTPDRSSPGRSCVPAPAVLPARVASKPLPSSPMPKKPAALHQAALRDSERARPRQAAVISALKG